MIMKKSSFYVAVVAVMGLLFASCAPDEPSFEEELLFGKWQEIGTQVYYTYEQDYTGKTWDEADDVTEEEAQPFTWTLDKSDLTQIHIMQSGTKLPKYYTVIELTASSLKYEDETGGKEHSFKKVK